MDEVDTWIALPEERLKGVFQLVLADIQPDIRATRPRRLVHRFHIRGAVVPLPHIAEIVVVAGRGRQAVRALERSHPVLEQGGPRIVRLACAPISARSTFLAVSELPTTMAPRPESGTLRHSRAD
jgi:hypothetical protein